ncbi:DHA2 family efflux MFS transporter permease subunit [Jongsikchunia kroppenstedtii]|uniref:DHA2 family efflux MFS transporter permease subunit n=1 Tax=Jongsikchunia kroppenstedtii TaxID=1121721 RepID=UPI00036EF268|nr:DHA2 family efflux MFS transporter permease subunit [Jongsikchunia kroppenstedtii]
MESDAVEADTGNVPRHVWRIAGVIVFGALMSTLDTSLVTIGLHTIGVDLHADLGAVQWIASGYLLALAVSLPVCGWLIRRFGGAPVWIGAMAAFTITSALCAAATTLPMLIAIRVLQGLAAGLLLPAGQAIIGAAAGPKRLGRVMSLIGIAVVVGPAIGPTVGGLLLRWSSWEWLFLINIPLGIMAVILGLRVIPRGDGGQAGPLDVRGLVLTALGVPLLVYGVTEIGEKGSVTAVSAWLPTLAGVVLLALYVVVARRSEHPILDLAVFRDRTFSAATIATAFNGAALFGTMLVLPLYFQQVRHESVVSTGVSLILFGVGGMIAMPVAAQLSERFGAGRIGFLGAALAAVTSFPFIFLSSDPNAILLQALLLIRGFAIGLTAMPVITAAYATVQRSQLPDAAALVNIAQRIGGSVGSAILAVVLYRATASGMNSADSFTQVFAWLAGTSVVAAISAVGLLRIGAERPTKTSVVDIEYDELRIDMEADRKLSATKSND